jgi:hypothetical protein
MVYLETVPRVAKTLPTAGRGLRHATSLRLDSSPFHNYGFGYRNCGAAVTYRTWPPADPVDEELEELEELELLPPE